MRTPTAGRDVPGFLRPSRGSSAAAAGRRWAAVAALAASRAHGIFIALVLAAWAAAVCLVNAGTFRLRRRGIYTAGFVDALFTPVRGWAAAGRRTEILPEWLVRLLFGVALLVCLAVTLPDQVNAVAYLTDSTPTAVFLPRSYIQDCGKDGCTTRTAGILQTSGLPAIWPAQLPLDRAILVQAPVWRADTSPTLMTSNPAVGYTLLAMIIDAAAASTLFGYILRLSRRLRRTRSRDRPGWLLSWLS